MNTGIYKIVTTKKAGTQQEFLEQKFLMDWAGKIRIRDDDVMPGAYISDYLYAIPNGGTRALVQDLGGNSFSLEAKRMKAMGVKAGVSDLHLPLARLGYHSLYVEMKRRVETFRSRGEAVASVGDDQLLWLQRMQRAGNAACVCYGWFDAGEIIRHYLGGNATAFASLYSKLNAPFPGLFQMPTAGERA